MRFRIVCLAGIAGLFVAGAAFGQGAGRSLDIQPGGRQNGMGSAGVALIGSPTSATWWNPAGLGFVDHAGVELTYAKLVPDLADDVSYNYGAYVQPVRGWGAVGLGIVFLSYGQSERRDDDGTFGGYFSSNEFSPALYYGTRVLPDMAIGAAVKYVRIQLDPNGEGGVGTSFALDLGALYRIPAAHLNLGANVQNLGPSVTFLSEDQSSPLSRNLKVGAAWEAYADETFSATAAADFNQSLVTTEFRIYNGGVEVAYTKQLAGRVGWYSDPLGDISGVTFGIGVGWKSLAVDFGSVPQARGLDHVSKITLGYTF